VRYHLSGGRTLSDEERRTAGTLLAQLRLSAEPNLHPDARKGRHALIAKMLLTYPVANASAPVGEARGEAYRDALDDVPPWALDEAIRAWHRGACGEHDYRWAPAPAVLRAAALARVAPVDAAIADLEKLVAAMALERAMDIAPLEPALSLVPTMKKI
jgi:hypothetical protein